jgi:hypothetical protein
METAGQYRARMERRKYVPPDERMAQAVEAQINYVKEYKVFTVIEQEKAEEIEANARMRGMTDVFFLNVGNFYNEWSADKDNEGKPFSIFLNLQKGDPFFGKKTDSLYTTLNTAINRLKLREEWQLTKHDQDEEKVLVLIRKR